MTPERQCLKATAVDADTCAVLWRWGLVVALLIAGVGTALVVMKFLEFVASQN